MKTWTLSVASSYQAGRVWSVGLTTITPPPPTMLVTWIFHGSCLQSYEHMRVNFICVFIAQIRYWSTHVLVTQVCRLFKYKIGDYDCQAAQTKMGIMSYGWEIYLQYIPAWDQITLTGHVLREFKKMDNSGQRTFAVLTLVVMPPGCASYMCKYR